MTTGASEDKDARLIILLESLESLAQRGRGCRIDRVARLRPVERQDADMAFIFIDDGAHDASPPRTRDKRPSVAKAIPSASSKEGCNPNTTVVTWPKQCDSFLSTAKKTHSNPRDCGSPHCPTV